MKAINFYRWQINNSEWLQDIFDGKIDLDDYPEHGLVLECKKCDGSGEIDHSFCGNVFQCGACGGYGFLEPKRLSPEKLANYIYLATCEDEGTEPNFEKGKLESCET